MLFKLKSVLYPPDATAINRRRYKITRFFLAVVYEHCITMKHFWFGDKIETSLNLFLFIYFQGSEFSRSAFGCHENSDPGKQIKNTSLESQTIDLLFPTSLESQESYLTTGMLPYKHSSFFPPSHGSIMLPPRQPRVFARLGSLAIIFIGRTKYIKR